MHWGNGLTRVAVVGLVTITLATIAAVFVLSIEHAQVPGALADALPTEILSLFGGQLFLGHAAVTQTMAAGLTNSMPTSAATDPSDGITPAIGSPASAGGFESATAGTTTNPSSAEVAQG